MKKFGLQTSLEEKPFFPFAAILLMVYAALRGVGGVSRIVFVVLSPLIYGEDVAYYLPLSSRIFWVVYGLLFMAEGVVLLAIAVLLMTRQRKLCVTIPSAALVFGLMLIWGAETGWSFFDFLREVLTYTRWYGSMWEAILSGFERFGLLILRIAGTMMLSLAWGILAGWLFVKRKTGVLVQISKVLFFICVIGSGVIVLLGGVAALLFDIVVSLIGILTTGSVEWLWWSFRETIVGWVVDLCFGEWTPWLIAATGLIGAWLLKPCRTPKKQETAARVSEADTESEDEPAEEIALMSANPVE